MPLYSLSKSIQQSDDTSQGAIPHPGTSKCLAHHSDRPLRIVTLCGSADSKSDAVRGSQDILETAFAERGLTVRPVDLLDWSLPRVPALLRAIGRERPDVILMQYPSHAFGSSFGPLAVVALQRVAPVVIMLHEFVAAHPLRKLAVGGLTARATLVATTAERQAESLRQWYPWLRPRLRHIPIFPNVPEREWVPQLRPKVSYFGQLRPSKGIEDFLQCQEVISAQMPEVEFEIVGSIVPKFKDFADGIIAQAQARSVSMIIDREIEEVADVLATATVALLPFPDGASFRRSSMLAMANCGVPIVTTTGSDTPADLRPFIEQAVDVADLARLTLLYLRDEGSRLTAHRQSRALVSGFGWSASVDGYLALFEEAVRRSPAARNGYTS
jgi:glycosyltransferase involved in cell wall biosynthesis